MKISENMDVVQNVNHEQANTVQIPPKFDYEFLRCQSHQSTNSLIAKRIITYNRKRLDMLPRLQSF